MSFDFMTSSIKKLGDGDKMHVLYFKNVNDTCLNVFFF